MVGDEGDDASEPVTPVRLREQTSNQRRSLGPRVGAIAKAGLPSPTVSASRLMQGHADRISALLGPNFSAVAASYPRISTAALLGPSVGAIAKAPIAEPGLRFRELAREMNSMLEVSGAGMRVAPATLETAVGLAADLDLDPPDPGHEALLGDHKVDRARWQLMVIVVVYSFIADGLVHAYADHAHLVGELTTLFGLMGISLPRRTIWQITGRVYDWLNPPPDNE